jgi:hypothetical protein
VAEGKLSEVFLRAADYYRARGEDGLEPYIQAELDGAEAYVRKLMERNVLSRNR